MFTTKIKYNDFNEVECEEELNFNLTETELTEMELSVDGGFSEQLKKLAAAKKVPEMVKIYRNFIISSYGVKSADGKRFMKDDKITADFVSSAAYDALMVRLYSEADFAMNFIKSIVPAKYRASLQNANAEA